MHFFLTGERQIGKSTVIKKALAAFGGSLGGFVTAFADDPSLGGRALLLHPLDKPRHDEEARVVARAHGAGMLAVAGRFDRLGVAALMDARRVKLILMDECGYLEREAHAFRSAVLQALDASVPVLGVVRLGGGSFTDAISRHPMVRLHTVTTENRDALAVEATSWIKEIHR